MTSSTLKLRVPAPFPANVVGNGGIQVQKVGGVWIIAPNFSALAQLASVPNPASKEVWVFDPVAQTYCVVSLATLGQSLFADTSASSITIGLGAQVFTVDPGKIWQPGSWVIASSSANPANFMVGQVTAYATAPGGATTLTLNITNIGGSGTFASWNLMLTGPPPAAFSGLEFVVDGGGQPIIGGMQGFLEVPFACTIQRVTLVADVVGLCVVDIWRAVGLGNFPPTQANSITASDQPTLNNTSSFQDTALTGWATQLNAGDILAFVVESAATITHLTISLAVIRH